LLSFLLHALFTDLELPRELCSRVTPQYKLPPSLTSLSAFFCLGDPTCIFDQSTRARLERQVRPSATTPCDFFDQNQATLPCDKPNNLCSREQQHPCANMPRTMFINPFKKHDVSEFPGVLQPLDRAPNRASVSADPRTSTAPTEKDDKQDETLRRPDSNASSGIVNHGLTKESLKADIIADVAASDTDTPYDRKATSQSPSNYANQQ
jgi:hypothetical protein